MDPVGKIWPNLTTEDNINEVALTWSVLPQKNRMIKIKNFHSHFFCNIRFGNLRLSVGQISKKFKLKNVWDLICIFNSDSVSKFSGLIWFLVFFILCDIWWTVENYFQKILSPPPSPIMKKSTFPFLLTPPPKNSKIASPPLFENFEHFSAPPAEIEEDTM